ncbi:MAG: hypothetical protein P1V97_02960, partial [Planctomycetota bacterium]|nr:hypothetical protein [Planctomycetota bacterium]
PPTTALGIAFHLLETESWESGRRMIEAAIKSGRLSESELERACFVLADSYAKTGHYLKARDRCLDLAKMNPDATLQGLIRSLAYSISAAKEHPEAATVIHVQARDQLERAKELMNSRDSTDSDLRATLQKYEQQLGMRTLCDWDFSNSRSYPETVIITGPQHFLPGGKGLLIHAAGDSKVGLQLPIEFQGGPLEIQLELTVRWIERYHGFRMSFKKADRPTTSTFEFALNCDGQGHEDACHRYMRAQFSGLQGRDWEVPVEHFDPHRRIKIVLRYDHLGLTREIVCMNGDVKSRSTGAIQQQLAPGLYQLCLEPTMNGDQGHSSLASFVEVHRMTVRGLRSLTLGKLGEPKDELMNRLALAKRALLLGEDHEALKCLSGVTSRELLKKDLLLSVLQMEALATARIGQLETATALFQKAKKLDKRGFEEFWSRILPLLSDNVRGSLAPLYFSSRDASYRENQSRRLSQLGEPHKALLGLGSLTGKSGEWRLFESELGLRCGDYSRSLSRLSPLMKSNQKARRAAGFCAYRMGDYKQASMLWQRVEIGTELGDYPGFLHAYRRAKRWTEKADGAR